MSVGELAVCLRQGGRKEGRGNEPASSCAMCDAQSTGSRALEGKNRRKMAGQNKILQHIQSSLLRMNGKTFFFAVWQWSSLYNLQALSSE